MAIYKEIRLILGDQLNTQHSWFRSADPDVLYVLMEVASEATYVRHHIQKVVGFFAAMRQFAQFLTENGHNVRYFKLDDPDNAQSFEGNLGTLIKAHGSSKWAYQWPDEYRLDVYLADLAKKWQDTEGVACEVVDSEHFMSDRSAVAQLFKGKKTYLMETFYRKMRLKYGLLMAEDGQTPLGNQWNFDADNRQKLPKTVAVPPPLQFQHNVAEIVAMVEKQAVPTIGRIEPTRFDWCLNRAEARALLDHFVKIRLPLFGTYEDAMTVRSYLVFHSKLSFALNIKLLSPLEVVTAAIDYWEKHQTHISLAQIEGFVRQIIGWREFMRGVYWAEMPHFAQRNFFDHQAELPEWFWTGDTKMNCLKHAIGQSLDRAYAHHIQRLMVTGNFALLLGVSPDALDAWYLGIYMDALDWVEITNTRGMSQFADGGLIATKPYVASANYIDKMSDYCGQCAYDKKARTGPKACPFNSLYWDFFDRHRDKLAKNPRIGMAYQNLKKMDETTLQDIRRQAAFYKKNINAL